MLTFNDLGVLGFIHTSLKLMIQSVPEDKWFLLGFISFELFYPGNKYLIG